MQSSAPFPRKHRQRYSRSKEGCLGCRARRKKCDGQKPVCSLCLRKKVSCEWPPSRAPIEGLRIVQHVPQLAESATRNNSEHATAVTIGARVWHQPMSAIVSPQAMRAQMRAISATLFGPDEVSRPFSPFWRLLELLPHASGAFSYALDALALAQLGTTHMDQRLLDRAARSYFHSIRSLQDELCRIRTASSIPDTLIGTPYLLFLCGRFNLSPHLHCNKNSLAHLQGWGYLLHLKGKPKSMLHSMLMHCFYSYMLENAVQRRQDVFALVDGFEMSHIECGNAYCGGLLTHTMGTPKLMQRADHLLSHDLRSINSGADLLGQASELLQELKNHEKSLSAYFKIWNALESPVPHRIVPTTSLISENQRLDSLSLALFDTAFMFPSFAAARLHKQYLQDIHIIEDIQRQLIPLTQQDPQSPALPSAHGITRIADDICRTIIYMCASRISGSHGYYCASGAVRYLRPWYLSDGQDDKVDWCDAVWAFLRENHVTITEAGA